MKFVWWSSEDALAHLDSEHFPSERRWLFHFPGGAVLPSYKDFLGSESKHGLWGGMCNSEVGNGKSRVVILVCSAGNPRSIEIAALIRDPAWSCRPQEFDQSKPLRCRQAQVRPKWPWQQCIVLLQGTFQCSAILHFSYSLFSWRGSDDRSDLSRGVEGLGTGHAFQPLSPNHYWTEVGGK